MFTGLIAELGIVRNLTGNSNGYRLAIQADKILTDLHIGDSVAVNGACLTVTDINNKSVIMDVMPETANHTTIPKLHMGEKVNLERTLRLSDRLDGHIVAGHVEGIGRIINRHEEGNAIIFDISAAPELTRYIIPKGSVAVDGISLTVTQVTENSFTVSIIPHTAANTTLGFKRLNDFVNIETDIIGRYIEKFTGSAKDFWQQLKH